MKIRLSAKKSLVLTAVSMLMCISMLIGTTYAWFTDSAVSSHNKIKSGSLRVSMSKYDIDDSKWVDISESTAPVFSDKLWEPGFTDFVMLRVANSGDLALKYRMSFVGLSIPKEGKRLSDVIDVYTLTNSETNLAVPASREAVTQSPWAFKGTLTEFVERTVATGQLAAGENSFNNICIALVMKTDVSNDYQGLNLGDFDVSLVATQLTAEMDSFDNQYDTEATFPWDGTVDTSWYNTTDKTFELSTPEQLAGLAKLVNDKTDEKYGFNNKTIKLTSDIDLANKTWKSIGKDSTQQFMGTFDGQGHTIKNLNTTTGNEIGLFGVIMNGTIRNINIINASINGNRSSVYTAVVCGQSRGAVVIENVHVKNAAVKGENLVGGIVGFQSNDGATLTISNCSVSDSKFSLNYNGAGIVGSSSSLVLDNCKVDNIEHSLYSHPTTYAEFDNSTYYLSKKTIAWADLYCDLSTNVVYEGVTYTGKGHN